MSDPIAFYRQQTAVTDPADHAALYDAVPDDLGAMAQAVQGLVFHYMADAHMLRYRYPRFRMVEIDTRYVSDILSKLLVMDNRPLIEARDPQHRMIGCCRDFAILFVSMARHKGYAARARYGFAGYLQKAHFIDHVIAEVWDAQQQVWQRIDPQMSPLNVGAYGITFDVMHIPADQFLTGGEAWQQVRRRMAPADQFCLMPRSKLKGRPFIKTRLLLDFASLNGHELLCWDRWSGDDSDANISHTAELTIEADSHFDELRDWFREGALRMPTEIACWSPAYPDAMLPRPVTLRSAE